MRLLISAGEASGELYAAALAAELRRRLPEIECFGMGGERLREAGCELVVDARRISVVGLAEVVRHLPRIWGEYRRLLRAVDARRPDAAILVDFPDFHLRLARQLHRRGIPVLYFVSPQLWAWRAGRVRQVRRYVRKMLVIFPFEQEFYRRHGIEAEFVGHPLADVAPPPLDRDRYAQEFGLHPRKEWIALLPGSRRREVQMNLPAMLEAARSLGYRYQFLLPVAPSLDPFWVGAQVRRCQGEVTLVRDARSALGHARAAIVASGTATVEAALMGTPFVMVYRVSPLTWMLGRRLVRLDRFAMVNLIAGEEVVPELVQADFTPANVAARLNEILPDGPARERMLAGLERVRTSLRGAASGAETVPGSAIERAAEAVLRAVR